eukprot:c11957_g1_i1.p1 GENE.c11957_g1_i1~~c11957_g1_i1.p1  ORF type:complete len:141 (-),score=14.53 c11957_g1_i1:16-438(-)
MCMYVYVCMSFCIYISCPKNLEHFKNVEHALKTQTHFVRGLSAFRTRSCDASAEKAKCIVMAKKFRTTDCARARNVHISTLCGCLQSTSSPQIPGLTSLLSKVKSDAIRERVVQMAQSQQLLSLSDICDLVTHPHVPLSC